MSNMRNRAPRFGVRQPVRFYRIDELVSARAEDLSASGAFVRTDAWLPVNAVVDLYLDMPDGRELTLPSRVAHCLPGPRATEVGRAQGIGFAFLPSDLPSGPAWADHLQVLSSDDWLSEQRQASVLVACHNERLLQRTVNALEGVAREVGFASEATAPDHLDPDCWDVVIASDVMAAGPALAELCRASILPPPVVVLLSSDRADGPPPLRAETHTLRTPFTDGELQALVQAAALRRVRPDIAGRLDAMPATSVLGLLDHERRQGVLSLAQDGITIHIHVRDGMVFAVEGPGSASEEALIARALDFRSGRFEFRACPIQSGGRGGAPIMQGLLELARRRDEASRRRS